MHAATPKITEEKYALLYCRVSGTKQAKQGHGLESQETRCREYAEAKGYQVEAVFPDDASGGGDFMNRPGMVALLSYLDAQKGKPYVIIFDDLKRFARDTEFHIKLRKAFASRSAEVECLNFRFENSPEGKFIETIIAAQGELEREQNGRQTLQKMKARLQRGYWVFREPTGYKYQKSGEHGKLLVRDEPAASVIEEALTGFAQGRFSIQAEVQRFLEDDPRYPARHVHPQRVTDLLTRPIYAGLIEHEDWDVSLRKGHHKGLISAETFKRIQERRAGVKKLPMRTDINRDFVLRGAVCCGDCGVPYRSAWSRGKRKKYAYYVCQTKSCESYGKSIPRDKLEGEFEDLLQHITPTETAFSLARKMFRKAWNQQLEKSQEMKAHIKKEIVATTRKSEAILDKIVATTNERIAASLEKRFSELELTKVALEEKLANQGKPVRPFEEALEHTLLFLASPWDAWKKGSFELRRTILKLVLTSPLHYYRNKGPRTPEIAFPFNMLNVDSRKDFEMVPRRGLEPPRPYGH
ncbi:MAG: recombinase family protein [Pseudomonadota bacterium]